jgi:hypothetical protein
MEATCSSETSVKFQRTTWRHIPEDITLSTQNLIGNCGGGEYLKAEKETGLKLMLTKHSDMLKLHADSGGYYT